MYLTLNSGKINCFWISEHALTHGLVDQVFHLCRPEALNQHLCHAEQGELFCFSLPKRGLCRYTCYLCQSKKGHAKHQHFNSTRVKLTPHTTQRSSLLIIFLMPIQFIILQQQQQRLGAQLQKLFFGNFPLPNITALQHLLPCRCHTNIIWLMALSPTCARISLRFHLLSLLSTKSSSLPGETVELCPEWGRKEKVGLYQTNPQIILSTCSHD